MRDIVRVMRRWLVVTGMMAACASNAPSSDTTDACTLTITTSRGAGAYGCTLNVTWYSSENQTHFDLNAVGYLGGGADATISWPNEPTRLTYHSNDAGVMGEACISEISQPSSIECAANGVGQDWYTVTLTDLVPTATTDGKQYEVHGSFTALLSTRIMSATF